MDFDKMMARLKANPTMASLPRQDVRQRFRVALEESIALRRQSQELRRRSKAIQQWRSPAFENLGDGP